MIEKEEYNEKQVPKMSWKFLSRSRSRSLFLRVCRQLRWTSATEFFVLLNRRVGQTQLVHRERQGGGAGGGGGGRTEMEDGKEQANPSIIPNIWLPLVTAINTSCLFGTSLPYIFQRGKDQGERRKKKGMQK